MLNKSSYIKKIDELLVGTSKFVKVQFNKKHKVNQELRHLLDLEGNIKTGLANLLEKHHISKEDYNFLKPCGSRPGIMYRLCKVHKGRGASNDLPPLQPVLSAKETCTYTIPKLLIPILKDFTLNEYTVRDLLFFVMQFKITIFIWHLLTLNHFL